ncbi:transcription elongation factor B polypeptide 3 [Vespula pensylvanica]|uniref:TFIIS N-terminal domain-containing protein n=1 Tax=Vespula pensylvanica TaxID=30213 RepID=A0A834NPU9_VESPE|nr:transcription elongation factor B polypeptide 3 [Vespula pensylvanica]KAF7415292.1 hypothetical protein H0235_011884 [Vespula pensylvanica]
MSVVEKIQHCQRNIKKCCDNEDKMLHYIQRLYTLPVTVQHLQDTGVGRTVNALRKYEGGVGDAAKALVAKWKAMVADEETSDGEDEDEACVPDAPESYDSPESPKLKEKQKADSTMKISRRKSDSSKHRSQQKPEKNYVSEHNSKHSSKSDIKVKSENESNINKESSKHLKNESQKEKHDKSHSSKHESKQEKRLNSNDIKNSSSTHLKKSSDKLSHNSKLDSNTGDNEESNKKRKLDSSNSGRKKSKRRKHSENESEEDRSIYHAEKQSTDEFETELNKKTEVLSKQDVLNKVESKSEKNKSREKGKQSSSKEEKVHNDKNKKKSDENREKQKTKDSHHSNKSSTSKSHHSSSNKDHVKDKDKTKRKESEEKKHKHQSKNSSDTKETKSGFKETKEKVKIKQEINGDEGIDCNSGASFAEALGMCTVAPSLRKRHNNSPNLSSAKVIKLETNISSTLNNKKQSSVKNEPTSSDSLHPLSLLSPNVKLEPLSVNLASTLPEISPNYKPLPYINPVHRKEEDKVLSDVIHVKNQRTKVYSGNKTGYTSVPSLYEICIRVLIENIDALEFTGGVPYDIIKPVLERATPDQLFMLEHYNPYLIDDTDALWQFHCNREFRNKQREEMETWREMYMRCLDEREAKLKTLTANIKQSIDKTVPLRSTKLAYVDNVVKPPRNVLKKQAKYGTANSVPTSTSDLKKKLIIGGGPTAATNISVPPPPMNRVKSSSAMTKKTKAPLMAKALQLIKGRYKR